MQLAVSDSGEGNDAGTAGVHIRTLLHNQAQGKGTGLGLAMVYGFIKRSGGFIKVHPGKTWAAHSGLYLPRAANAHSVQPHRSAAGRPQMPAASAPAPSWWLTTRKSCWR